MDKTKEKTKNNILINVDEELIRYARENPLHDDDFIKVYPPELTLGEIFKEIKESLKMLFKKWTSRK